MADSWKTLNYAVTLIQTAFRTFMAQKRDKKALEMLKARLGALVKGWTTRKALNCLSSEINEYVQNRDRIQKERLRCEFNLLFERVMEDKLFLPKKKELLAQFRLMH